jgi:peptidoglycan/LPS O-acetylase OafA/YrhL
VQHYDFILVVLLSISTFEMLTRGEQILQHHSIPQSFITAISKISFGVYMMHIFVGGAIFQLLKSTGMTTPIGKPFSSFSSIIAYLLFISATIIGIQIIILIIKKNKFIRRYVLLMK